LSLTGKPFGAAESAGGPEYFCRLQRAFRDALAVKIDVPTAVFYNLVFIRANK
jgi:hypothetical protein